jgi:hypothetical protein
MRQATVFICQLGNPGAEQGPVTLKTRASKTMDVYGHLFPDASEHGRGALDAMFAPAGVRPMCARE